ncbi:MAG: Fic family protein [Thalassolituus sp.]|jgi:cell filamentation protein|uniref:Fic/DOC family protein n=1 Tax=Thalassolituus TaxID=187492 RepID=UPI00042DDB58|nr:Fic family protein [Thalassolituus oleivorans]AHK14623.1 cell filamentation protein Fic [Thalassolituus oleivorans R6-15]PCI50174.1 MAG: cell filamentation protein Fic [Oceanospirillales bacterium]
MEAYSQYDLSEHDPYLINNSSCLKNLLGHTNTTSLNEAERRITQQTLAQLIASPVQPSFDLKHLAEIHRRIFRHVYPFAGELRKVEIGKGNKLFLPYALIHREAAACFSQLMTENYLRGLDANTFGQRAGFYLGWINKIHAFREGNGRTQRVFIDQLASQNDYFIEWSSISGQAMADASRSARTIDVSARDLGRLLSMNIVKREG